MEINKTLALFCGGLFLGNIIYRTRKSMKEEKEKENKIIRGIQEDLEREFEKCQKE